MHVANIRRPSSKMQEYTMHAIIKLQFNTFEPIRDLTLQLDMNHARINLNTIMRG